LAYLPENHYCVACKVYLGDDDGDAICPECDNSFCSVCEKFTTYDKLIEREYDFICKECFNKNGID